MLSCKSEKEHSEPKNITKEILTKMIVTDQFEIIKPTDNSKAVLILFGGFGEKPADIKREFPILEIAL